MGYMIAMGACAACHRPMSFNPNTVPSIRVNGLREPVCKACIDAENVRRKALNDPALPPLTYRPDAYEPEEV
jgi:hypothetical protein